MGEFHTGFWLENIRERNNPEKPGTDQKILQCISKKQDGRRRLDWSGSGYGQVAGSCEERNELSGYI